ncbi:MAG: hypothetical protein QOJ09_1658 [Actinomycetota bacterium]|jgi:hypothetical protein|nr:hypothetical protein [Actinomycetota bacterium]
MPDLHHRHPAFVLSCAFGALGVVLLLAGLVASANALYFAAIAIGSVSLACALYWRSLLVADWAERKPRTR